MSKDREKEIQHLLYLKEQLIRQAKKESQTLRRELQQLQGEKRLTKKEGKHGRTK